MYSCSFNKEHNLFYSSSQEAIMKVSWVNTCLKVLLPPSKYRHKMEAKKKQIRFVKSVLKCFCINIRWKMVWTNPWFLMCFVYWELLLLKRATMSIPYDFQQRYHLTLFPNLTAVCGAVLLHVFLNMKHWYLQRGLLASYEGMYLFPSFCVYVILYILNCKLTDWRERKKLSERERENFHT